jgi:hypothetical protein
MTDSWSVTDLAPGLIIFFPKQCTPHARIHEDCEFAGEKFYKDPDTGLMVMTEVIHLQRGKCCGSGCRHCPFAHERVPLSKRMNLIKQPAWLVPPKWATSMRSGGSSVQEQPGNSDHSGALKVVVLFWSTGKDSFLAYRALCRASRGKQTGADPLIPVRCFLDTRYLPAI